MGCPVFPKPIKNKLGLLGLFFKKRRSWLDALFEKSYGMKMGEINLPGLDVFMINEPKLVNRVMIKEVKDFPKHHMLGDALEPLLGQSIFTTSGEQWRQQRAMLDPVFGLTRIQHVFGLMQAAVKDMEERIATKVKSGPYVDVDPEMPRVTADVIFRTIMSSHLDPVRGMQILEAFNRFQAEVPKITLMKLFHMPSWLSFANQRKRDQAGAIIRSNIEDIIRPRYEEACARRAKGEPSPHQDMLESLLQTVNTDTGDYFPFKDLVDQVSMLFLAGHETSASTLTWALYLLAMHPEIQEDAYKEITTEVKSWPMSVESLNKLPLVHDIFREALRLYPPVGFFARENEHETTMRKKTIAKKSTIVVAPWLIHRHRDYWDNPDGFDPYRFSRGSLKTPLRETYLPFGMGPRVCIGAAFAKQEGILVLTSLIRRYKMRLVPGFVPEPVGRLTIRSENGMHLILEPR